MGKRLAFFSPQGTMIQENNLYEKRQGSTAENGGQVIYVTEMARAVAQLGGEVDVFARNYDTDEVIVEEPAEYPGMRIIHIPTAAEESVEKEHFYRYYTEYMGRAFDFLDQDGAVYDSAVGHYADGMFMAAALAERQDPTHPISTVGVTHSLGLEKRDSLQRKTTAENPDDAAAARHAFSDAVEKYNIGPRLACEAAAFLRMDTMATISELHNATLWDEYKYPEDRMSIIPGGINESIFKAEKKSRTEKLIAREALVEGLADRDDISAESKRVIQEGKVIFGFGRLVEAKGVSYAVEAMEHILEQHPDAIYVYAGGNVPPKNEEETKLLEKCRSHAEAKGYADRVVFLGRQDQPRIGDWLNASDAYLHAASLEPFGLAPQEAAATGIPVILSKNAGVADVLENNKHALHVDPLSPKDIAKQTNRILSNPLEAKRLSQAALRYIETEATWKGRTERMMEFADEAHSYKNRTPELIIPEGTDAEAAIQLITERDPSKNMSDSERACMREARTIMTGMITPVITELTNDLKAKLEDELGPEGADIIPLHAERG